MCTLLAILYSLSTRFFFNRFDSTSYFFLLLLFMCVCVRVCYVMASFCASVHCGCWNTKKEKEGKKDARRLFASCVCVRSWLT